jgi:hypothetical protein
VPGITSLTERACPGVILTLQSIDILLGSNVAVGNESSAPMLLETWSEASDTCQNLVLGAGSSIAAEFARAALAGPLIII